jgi:DNA-directed DNA polymerase III PolC
VAVGHLPEVVARVKAIGWSVAPITDRASTFGFTKWTKLAAKAGLRPIYGVELAVVVELGVKKPVTDYWTFIAIDELQPLHDLIGLATDNPGWEPCLTYPQALNAAGVIKIAGERVQLDQVKGRPKDFYLSLSPATPKQLARQNRFRFIANSDNYFPTANDMEFYRITLGKRAFTQTYPQFILSDAEWRIAVQWVADGKMQNDALANRNKVFTRCRAVMRHATLLRPQRPQTLRAMCEAGAVRTGVDLSDRIYKDRLDRELALIEEKQFADYFYVIADMVNWAKARMIVGPARGSSCGSLVCYLLNITTIDPIPYGLLFERFIDTNRTDLPDIDIDFSDQRRQLVFDYAEQKYGAAHVARLGTVGMFMPRSALKATGIALKIPIWMVDRTLDSVVERSSGDSRAMLALEDTLVGTDAGKKLLAEFPEATIAGRLEGHPNNASQHAAGIVLTQEPINNYVAVDRRTKSAMVDKKDAEDLNLLKIDALGLTQLSIFERTLQLIDKPDISGWLEKLPLDDPTAFEVLNKGHFAGVFQFNGGALQSLAKQVKIKHVEDIISITALARPGPMATGGAHSWVRRKNGQEEVSTMHPMLTQLTQDTYGVVVYQEQVMNVVRHMGQFSWDDTSAIRKAMSGRLGNEFFERYRLNFLKGAKANDINEATAEAIWKHINTMGSWAFNRSHAVAYGLVSYWCCYLKAHHPLEFAAATLDAENDPQKQIAILRELKSEGVDYVAVDADHSIDRWVAVKKGNAATLVGPLTAIKGIGPATVQEILACRKDGKPLRATLVKRLATAKTEIDSLTPIADAIARLHPDFIASKIVSRPWPVRTVQCGVDGEVMILGLARKIAPKDENEAVNIAKRSGKVLYGPTKAVNLFFLDDTDEIFAKISRFNYERLGKEVVERGRAGEALYAVKGQVWRGFRGIDITAIKFLGFINE